MDQKDGFFVSQYMLGVDLGETQDYTAIAVVRQLKNPATGQMALEVPQIERVPLNTRYTDIAEYLKSLLQSSQISGKMMGQPTGAWDAPRDGAEMIVDFTGAGQSVRQIFQDANLDVDGLCHMLPAKITAGSHVGAAGGYHTIPRPEIFSALEVAFQNETLKIADTLEYGPILRNELLNLRHRITPKGKDTVESWREKEHDDLVFALGLAVCWLANYRRD